ATRPGCRLTDELGPDPRDTESGRSSFPLRRTVLNAHIGVKCARRSLGAHFAADERRRSGRETFASSRFWGRVLARPTAYSDRIWCAQGAHCTKKALTLAGLCFGPSSSSSVRSSLRILPSPSSTTK